ncbi:MAG: MarR family transcriptional regulator [Pseudomonadota bacterium]
MMSENEQILTTPISENEIPQLENIELLFFAYRDFVSDPDKQLAHRNFGRAHHRVLYFVNRSPGMTVAELLDLLRITKQSLGRVLKQLIEAGHIVQNEGKSDRRKRLLYPTQKGRDLILELSQPQSERLSRALEGMDMDEKSKVVEFLKRMIGN